ncbi:MAG: peptide-N-glycosidase F-related protein [Polyangiaceae bacterium]
MSLLVRLAFLSLTGLFLLPACTGSDTSSGSSAGGSGATTTGGAGGTTATGPTPGPDALVAPFDKTHIYFAGDDNKRVVEAPAVFPMEGTYSKIVLHLALTCPDGGCDSWDRFGSLSLVAKGGANGGTDTEIEIARFITPYKVEAAWDIDVTDLRPLLTGEATVRAFIDTWVGPGSPYGAGWALSASFEMTGGVPEKEPIAAIPVWTRTAAVYGDPAKTIPSQLPQETVTLPEGAASYALRTFVTGHGQGNKDNCAEFCKRDHTITAGSTAHTQQIWRADCASTAVPGQQGTWKYSRAGWCPGADVLPWTLDVTADLAGQSNGTFAYDVEAYENTCRPDAATCQSCTLGVGCDYDGGAHTEPNYQVSSLLIAYR